jgi:hypothetical protein
MEIISFAICVTGGVVMTAVGCYQLNKNHQIKKLMEFREDYSVPIDSDTVLRKTTADEWIQIDKIVAVEEEDGLMPVVAGNTTILMPFTDEDDILLGHHIASPFKSKQFEACINISFVHSPNPIRHVFTPKQMSEIPSYKSFMRATSPIRYEVTKHSFLADKPIYLLGRQTNNNFQWHGISSSINKILQHKSHGKKYLMAGACLFVGGICLMPEKEVFDPLIKEM